MQNYAFALIRYQRVLELDDRNLKAHQGYIESMFHLGTIDHAIQEYELLNRNKPDDNILLYALGLAYSFRGTKIKDGIYVPSNVDPDDLVRSNKIIRKALSFDYNFVGMFT